MGHTSASVKGFHSDKGTGAVFEDIYVVEGKRTPFGKMSGSLSSMSPTDLGIISSKAALEAAGIPGKDISQTIVANIGQASADSFFLPRHIGLYAGAPIDSSALLVQRICGSGMEVVGQAAEQIAMGKGNVVLCCGVDTMSRFPLASYGMRQGFQLGKPDFIDLLWEALNDTAAVPMGETADILAKKYGLTRQEVDNFAFNSQNRYISALEAKFFDGEITPVLRAATFTRDGLKPRKYSIRIKEDVTRDEHPRKTTLEQLASLQPVFTKDGITTAGTASGIVDGAASVVIASGEYVRAHGLKPIGKVLGISSVGVDPSIMGIGPAPAIRSILSALKMNIKDIDLFEINEAFGPQCLSVAKDLELDLSKLNIHGGAIAIGHPLAATGCRLTATVLKSLRLKNKSLGIASACIGGGQGIALVVQAV